jgi:hypothetical protein
MSKYASILFGAEQHHNIGPFRLPVYHDLVPGESRRIEEVSRKFTAASYKSLQLAKRIAHDRGITMKEAVNLLGRANEPENEDLVMNYVSELEEIEQCQLSPTAQRIAFVTVLLKFRAEIKSPEDDEWRHVSDWSDEDTEHMPPALLDELFQFLTWERDGWPEAGKSPSPASKPPRKSSKNAEPSSTVA